MTSERGSVTIWMLGLVMVMLAIGGLVLDLWRVLDEKHRIEAIADAAAAAASAMIDETHYRATGQIVLDQAQARSRATEVLDAAGPVDASAIRTDPARVTVTLTQGVDLSLLQLLLPGEDRVTVRGRASGSPRLYP